MQVSDKSSITTFRGGALDDTISRIEQSISRMDYFCNAIPAPAILYSTKNLILWYNDPMERVLFGHNGRLPAHAKAKEVLNKPMREVLCEDAADYIERENAKVRETRMPQYDEYIPPGIPNRKWRCLRFPVQRTRVGAILLPSDDDIDFFTRA